MQAPRPWGTDACALDTCAMLIAVRAAARASKPPILPRFACRCPTCRASGRWCCASCMGTGVRRSPIGFRPHNDEEDDE